MASNVAVAQDPAGNLKPAKNKSTERIDGIVAAIMAIGRALVAQDEPYVESSMFFLWDSRTALPGVRLGSMCIEHHRAAALRQAGG